MDEYTVQQDILNVGGMELKVGDTIRVATSLTTSENYNLTKVDKSEKVIGQGVIKKDAFHLLRDKGWVTLSHPRE